MPCSARFSALKGIAAAARCVPAFCAASRRCAGVLMPVSSSAAAPIAGPDTVLPREPTVSAAGGDDGFCRSRALGELRAGELWTVAGRGFPVLAMGISSSEVDR
jgi:hypothetical protein